MNLPDMPQLLVTLLLMILLNPVVYAQVPLQVDPYAPDYDAGGEFNFVRVQFDTYYGGGFRGGFGGGTWAVDFPDADINFLRGVSRLTNIRVMSDPIVLRLDDEDIFDYPFLYMLEVGQNGGVSFNPQEIENLREYLLRGGFLLVDDFWGTRQWDNFYTAAPQQQRRCVEQYNIVKKA